MKTAFDFAKFFIKHKLDTNPNTYDGNMKLQKLLFFANYISLVERNAPLFAEKVRAFRNGCVVEEVRLRYRNDYAGLLADSMNYNPNLSQEEYDILNMTSDIFGGMTAKELSALNHSFSFWDNAYKRSSTDNPYGFKDKELSVVSDEEMLAESDRIKNVIAAYKENKSKNDPYELINGVKFYHDYGFEITDDVLSELEDFSMIAEDSSYFVYKDDGGLVIY